MKHGMIKKLISVLLVMLLVGAVPLSVLAAEKSYSPVIFIPEMTEIILYQNPNSLNERELFNPRSDKAQSYITDILAGILQANNDVPKGAAKINATIDEIFRQIKCDEYGNPVNVNMGPATYNTPVAYNTNDPIYSDNVAAFVTAAQRKVSNKEIFVFEYDWRIDPSENGALLQQYIERVKANTGKKKVSLIAGGYGGVVANAYLYYFPDAAKASLSSCVFLDSLATGSSLLGDIMSGDLIRTVSDSIKEFSGSIFDIGDVYDTLTGADVGDAFARYIKTDPTGMFSGAFTKLLGSSSYSSLLASLAISLISFIIEDQGLFTKVGSGYRETVIQADDLIYDGGLREYLRNIPGLWAVVPEDRYAQTIVFLYGSEENISAEMLDKIQRSHRMLLATETTLRGMQLGGVNVDVVAGYGLQILPLTSCFTEQSDGLQATRYAGMGAKTGDIKHGVTTSVRCRFGNHNHVEPADALDAATCFLPENTWFIKNHQHMDYSADTAAAFLVWLATSDSQRHVYQSNLYPQYLQKSVVGDQISALSVPSDSELTNYTYGDLDVNGRIDAADARLAMRYSVGLETPPSRIMLLVADVDGDYMITASDARLILRMSVGLENKFPVE